MGLIGPMSKADAADSDSTVRKHRQRGLIPWKPGQSGNPKGRPQGSRNKLTEDFFVISVMHGKLSASQR